MKKKVSLKDIAERVGVSTATVSYVLSKGKDSGVSEEVSKRVKQAAKELNYQPNQIAKSLKMGKTFTIGLVVADISNPFFAHIARIVEDEAAAKNYTVIFGSSDEKPKKMWRLLQYLINRQVDGFIITPTEGSEEQIKHLKEQNIPFVLIDRYYPEIPSNHVVIDNYKAAYDATSHLIEQGNKKVGMLAYDNTLFHMRERIRGYRDALKNHDIQFQPSWLHEINFADIKEKIAPAVDDMLQDGKGVDSIFFATNTLAVYGLKYLETINCTVGEDVSVVSFDEGEAFDFFYCPLTFIRQPLIELAKNAVQILNRHIDKNSLPLEHSCLDAKLIVRQSSLRKNED
ncbi:MAG: LacI family transcriptional regulator [Cytophagaceae bacterium]|nr:LacI family transcriptional regulator [Cytophagaceae bacterium]|tara:strand:+ start:7611 stop:8639 length:1029 start_codon:yes stop_codon:yes gene_type:complete